MNSIGKKRDNNYDYMRVFAMCMVVLNHIADYFVTLQNSYKWSNIRYTYVCESISHCAIPLFLMLTGVFVINKAGEIPPKDFYIKSAKKLGIPFGIFVIIYFVWDIWIVKTGSFTTIAKGVLTGFLGMYAHWYMVMLAVIYAFLPLIAFLKRRISERSWIKGVIVFFIWVMVGHYFETSSVSWSLCNMYFIGYVLLGDIIHRKLVSKKNHIKGMGMIGLGLLILALNGILLYHVVLNGGDYYNRLLNLYGAPLIVLASIIIFAGFSILKFEKSIHLLANISYIVFLSHKMIMNVVSATIYPILENKFNYNVAMLIPIEYFILLPISILVSIAIYRILNKLVYKRISL